MGKGSRFRISLNRRKLFNWERSTKIKVLIGSGITFGVILTVNILLNTVNFNSTKIIPIADASINEEIRASLEQDEIDIYLDVAKNNAEETLSLIDVEKTSKENNKTDNLKEEVKEEKEIKNEVKDTNKDVIDNKEEKSSTTNQTTTEKKSKTESLVYKDNTVKKDNVDFTVVGEIMMGANIGQNLDYAYPLAFKTISQYTRNADFTYGILATNITMVSRPENMKSKYLVTKDIKSAFATLGISALNIATDHITDYDKTFFSSTIEVLKSNKIYMAGINDSTLFVDVAGKKIAIIAALSSYIGNKTQYQEFGINLYDEEKMAKDIATAKDTADFVIVDVAWGREDRFGTTPLMSKIAYSAIDAGANLVIGSNALGTYPMYEYKGVPIIYSTGYLITDSDLILARRSYIWKFNINKDNRVDKVTMIPVCTENQTYTKDFRISDPEMCTANNEMINSWNDENGLNSVVNADGTITVTF